MSEDELLNLVGSLRERVQRLEDVEEIKVLHRTYIRQLADREWGSMLDHFAPDAVLDLRHHGARVGHKQIAELFESMRSSGNPHDGYVLSSPVIEVTGDAAIGEWTWHRHLCEFPVMGAIMRVYGPWWEGRYRCTYVRVEGRWKFQDVHFRLVAPDADIEADEALRLQEQAKTPIRGASR